MTSTPGAGHVHPMVPIARALRTAGHQVTWATAEVACPGLAAIGFECIPAGMDSAARTAAFLTLRPGVLDAPPREIRTGMYPMFSLVAAPRMISDLEPVMEDLEPDLVIHETLEWAGAPLAAARGIPHATVGFGGLLSDELLQVDAESRAALWASVGLEAPDAGGLYDHVYLHPFPPSLGTAPDDRNIHRVRPVGFDGATEDAAPPWIADLGRDRPFVYATFGTEWARRAPLATVVAAADGLDADIVLTVSRQVEPDALGPVPTNVRVEQYVPQRWMLERASLLVSHAGSGAVLGAAGYGVPQLSLPLGADQFENADAVTASGAGLTLESHHVNVDAIRAAIERLLGASFPERARSLRDEIAGMPEPATYVDRLADLRP